MTKSQLPGRWLKRILRSRTSCAARRIRSASQLAIALCCATLARYQQPAPNLSTPELVLQTGQTVQARSLAFSGDGKLLASGGYGSTAIYVWETATGRQLRLLSKHELSAGGILSGVTAVAINQDGLLLAATFGDNSFTVWNLNSGKEVFSQPGPHLS